MKKRSSKIRKTYAPRSPRKKSIKSEKDRKSLKFRIYLNNSQISELDEIINACRELYNTAITAKLLHYSFLKKNVSHISMCKIFSEAIDNFPVHKHKIHSQVSQNVLDRVDKTYKNYIKRIVKVNEEGKGKSIGLPRLKSKERYRSITFTQVYTNSKGNIAGGIRLINKKLEITGVSGTMSIKRHRPIEDKVKTASIVKDKDKYYLVLTTEKDKVEKLNSSSEEDIVAMDAGLTNFMTKHDGNIINFVNIKPHEEKAAKKASELSRKQKGSKRREKFKIQLNKAYDKVKNVRDNFLHQTSRKLVNTYNVIILEDLNIKSMIEKDQENNTHMSKNIYRKSWGKFMNMLSYKAEEAGKLTIFIDPRNTSKTCNSCEKIKQDLELSDREFKCNSCSYECDRDVNAAKNILKKGLEVLRSQNFCFQLKAENNSPERTAS